jgi:translocation and assembly module TamB
VNAERDASQMTAAASLNAPELSQLWPGLVGAATGEATINGNRGELVIDWQYQDIVVSADAAIRYSDQEVAGTVRSATVTQVDIGDWQLQNPFDFRAAAQDVQLDSSEWRGELGVVRIARLQVGGDQLEVNANIQEVPLQMGNQALPPNYRLSGYGSADVDLRRQAGLWNGTLNWSQTDTVLQVTEINGDVTDLKIPRAEATADLVDNRVTANGRIEIDPGVAAEVTLSLADLAADAAMTGTLKLTGDDWSWISALVPQIDRFTGAISADVAASGPLDGPTFSGTAKWQNGSVAIPAYNVRLKDVGVTLTGVSDGDATVEGSARSGGGELQLTGRLEDLLQPNRRASFTVTGKDA